MTADLVRRRWHPNLPEVLRVMPRPARWCKADGPVYVEDGEEFVYTCDRPRGHTGRHFDWEWAPGASHVVLSAVWTDAESTAYVSDGREVEW